MKTNDLKKGARVMLSNGWEADIWDNCKGVTRVALVYGFETEAGSVYSHDIAYFRADNGTWGKVEHTPAQLKLKAQVRTFGY